MQLQVFCAKTIGELEWRKKQGECPKDAMREHPVRDDRIPHTEYGPAIK